MAWLGTWSKRLKLTIDSSKVDTANLTDFPIMVYLSAASGIGDVDASALFDELGSDANRKKVAFTTSDGTTQIYAEIEKFDFSSEKAWYHVKVPTVTYDSDPYIYLYYDSAQADNTTYIGDTTDAVTHNVWDANFVGVWHMAQDPNGDGAGAIKDSTSNANDGTPAGTMLTADLVAGQVGKAIDFDGTDDEIAKADNATLDITGSHTLEAVYKTATVGGGEGVMGKYWNESPYTAQRSYAMLVGGSNQGVAGIVSDDGTTGAGHYNMVEGSSDSSDNVFHHAAVVFIPSTSITAYLDGAQDGQNTTTIVASVYSGTEPFRIGVYYSSDVASHFQGVIDEVRVSSTDRSAAWIKATYNSLWDSLITFGAEETPGVHVSATTATLTITPNAATVIAPTAVNATSVALIITPQNADVNLDVSFTATSPPLIITPNNATVVVDVINVLATSQSLVITPASTTISYDILISATSQSLTITPYDAVVWDGAAWNAWLSLNYEKVIRKYTFTLTGEDDGEEDIDIPFSSFQCRRRDGEPTYLSVVIKDTDYSSAIAARSNGDMKITMSYIVNGESVYEDVISIVDLEDIQLDRGGSNQSISLTGHRTVSYTPKSIELRDVTYYQLKDGKYIYRCAAPDLYLAPGDTATFEDVSFIVDHVQYTVSVLSQMMQVKEA